GAARARQVVAAAARAGVRAEAGAGDHRRAARQPLRRHAGDRGDRAAGPHRRRAGARHRRRARALADRRATDGARGRAGARAHAGQEARGGERAVHAGRRAQPDGVSLRRSGAARLLAGRALPAAQGGRRARPGARRPRPAAPDGDRAAGRRREKVKPISLFPGKVKLISLFCFLVAAGFAGCDKKPDLSRAPAIVAPRGWQAPAPLSRVTASGARVVLVPDHKLPLAHLMVTVQAGAELDPPDKPGLAVATANFLVDGGAGARSGRELAEAFEELGGELKIECDETGLRLSTPMLARNLDRALALVADLVARPRFDAAEWPSARDRQLAEIVRRRDEPRDAADTVFQRVLYGAHPYAHDELGTRAAVEKLTADDVRAFYAAHYGPRTTQVLLVGDAQLDDVAARLDAALAGWKSSAAPAPPPPDAAPSGARFVLVDRPGAPQSEVRVGHVGIARATPDYAAACLVEMILGGSFTSRLVQNLR